MRPKGIVSKPSTNFSSMEAAPGDTSLLVTNVRFVPPEAVLRGPRDADPPTRKLRQMTPRVGVHTL